MKITLWPRSLTGQIAMLVAIALFVAQAINFGLLLRERQQLRFSEITVPMVTRVVDAVVRVGTNRSPTPAMPPPPDGRRGPGPPQAQIVQSFAIPNDEPRVAEIEAAILAGVADANPSLIAPITLGRVYAFQSDIGPDDPRLKRMPPRRAERARRSRSIVQIAVEMPGRGWLIADAPWPRAGVSLIWQTIAQTLILYAVTLIPVLWVGNRIVRPLRALTRSAQNFSPGSDTTPMAESGPGDVRALIAAYNGLSDRVTAMLDEKDRMLGAIGHDLRTPLSALRVRIESVEDETDRARMADIIDEMHRTLEDILSLARLGRPSEPPTDVDLAALVDAVVEDFRDLGANVTAEESPRLKIRLRPSLMRRAVRNLIENAVKYGGGAEVRLVPSHDAIAIEVADRGPGIPADKIDSVFIPFTRLETSRNRDTGGIGLGLALAQAIVRDAGGTITLANRDGGGLLATIRLPRG